ncbi:MAG TPA: hypothetical protein VMQ62_12010 [Dongiaceae bacterium]|nr:hypothetical protein [Dongiaceae bacterium]
MDARKPDGPRFDRARVLGLARRAYREGVAAFEVRADRSALLRPEWTPCRVPEMQEPELQVLRKGFARVLSGAEIHRLLRSA